MKTALNFISLVMCAFVSTTLACTSEAMHPESVYCLADFVIKVQVRDQRNVYIQNDGRIVDADSEDEEVFQEEEDDDSPYVSNDMPPPMIPLDQAPSEEDFFGFQEENVPRQIVASRRGKYTAINFAAANRPSALISNLRKRSGKRGNSNPEVARFRNGPAVVRPPLIPPGVRSSSVTNFPRAEATPSRALMTEYSINILKVYKGSIVNKTGHLYTPPNGGLCMMSLKHKKPYIVMGKVRDGRFHLAQSGYKIEVTQLSSAELRHLARNMRHRYSSGCRDCEIKMCNQTCTEETTTNQCVWRNQYSLMDARASQFACIRKKNGVCQWYNRLNPRMVPEDLD